MLVLSRTLAASDPYHEVGRRSELPANADSCNNGVDQRR